MFFMRTRYFFSSFLRFYIVFFDIICYLTFFLLYLHTKRQTFSKYLHKTMENPHYNRIKAVLAEKDKTGTWLSEKMNRNLGTVSRWMTNKVQPSVEQLYDIAKHLDVDVRELLVASK